MKSMLLSRSSAKSYITELFSRAGVEINGSKAWDLQVTDERFYDRLVHYRSLGLGESYMERCWECHSIDEMINKLLTADLNTSLHLNLRVLYHSLLNRALNFQSIRRAKIVAKRHYDIGNDLYKAMLDREMIYSCAYWHRAETLDQAQLNKLELTCQKLQLKPGMRVLDIGCGWGGFAKYAAKQYGVEVVGITISEEQKKLAEKNCQGLPIEIRLQDYRHLSGTFDRIVSIGMFEHVGYKNYSTYMQVAHRHLKEEGIFLLHTIGSNDSSRCGDVWLTKYIFPNGMLPSIAQIGKSIEGLFVMEDWHNFGAHYDRTLLAWHKNFNAHWPKLKENYGETFPYMWNYYLLSCAGSFRSRCIQLWQIVLTKKGLTGGFPREKITAEFDHLCSAPSCDK